MNSLTRTNFIIFFNVQFLDDVKRQQTVCLRVKSLEEMLDDMHVDCDVDPLDDVLFDHMVSSQQPSERVSHSLTSLSFTSSRTAISMS